MGASSDARRHAVAQSNQTASLGLTSLGRTLSHVLNDEGDDEEDDDDDDDGDNNRGPGMAVT
jgi:hypothetical protein